MMRHNNVLMSSVSIDEHPVLIHSNSFSPTPKVAVSLYYVVLLSVFVCMCVYMCVYVCACMCMRACMHVCVDMFVSVCAFICFMIQLNLQNRGVVSTK